jgi:mono/diheme cytochrome c family protein
MDVGSDSRHPDFTGYLADAQVWNLVKFMREEWIDPNALYDLQVTGGPMGYAMVAGVWTLVKPTLTFTNVGQDGDAAAGTVVYNATCAGCHGADGTTLPIAGQSLGALVRAKPHEAWHKVKFGEPAAGMAPGLVTSTTDMKNLYKALADTVAFPD